MQTQQALSHALRKAGPRPPDLRTGITTLCFAEVGNGEPCGVSCPWAIALPRSGQLSSSCFCPHLTSTPSLSAPSLATRAQRSPFPPFSQVPPCFSPSTLHTLASAMRTPPPTYAAPQGTSPASVPNALSAGLGGALPGPTTDPSATKHQLKRWHHGRLLS